MTTTAIADTETPSTPAATQTVEAPKAETTTTPTTDAEKPAETTPVAKIGDTTYTSLADAVKAAKEGDTITLTGKITGNKNGAAKIQLQLVKDGKPLGDPITIEVNVTVEAIPVKVTVEKDKLTVNVKDGKLDEAKLLELTGAKADNGDAVLSVDANQLDALNKAIETNVAGDVIVGVTATWGDSSASTPVTITVSPVAFTANGFDWNLKDGELTADKVLELAKPSTDVKGYTFTVDDSQLAAVNKQIKDGKTGKIELTITGTADGLPTLSQTVTVNVTDGKTIKPTPDKDKTESPVDKLANTGVNPLIGISIAGGLTLLGAAAMIVRRKLARK